MATAAVLLDRRTGTAIREVATSETADCLLLSSRTNRHPFQFEYAAVVLTDSSMQQQPAASTWHAAVPAGCWEVTHRAAYCNCVQLFRQTY
jgi:hypothetical protein